MIRVLINKFTFMKDSKQSFKDLVKKMDSLEETQQGVNRQQKVDTIY